MKHCSSVLTARIHESHYWREGFELFTITFAGNITRPMLEDERLFFHQHENRWNRAIIRRPWRLPSTRASELSGACTMLISKLPAS